MKKVKGNKKQDKIFLESSLALFRLLAHHPHFLKSIESLRKKYHISVSTSISDMLVWKNDYRNKYHNLVEDVAKLASGFDVPPQLTRATKHFMLDYVFINQYDRPSMFEVGLNIIRPSESLKLVSLNPGSVYIEITSGTTEREIRDNWDKIVGKRKETRKLGVSKINPIDERVWELMKLQTPKLDKVTITSTLKKEFPGGSFFYNDINKRLFSYRQALSKLYPIK